MSRLGYRKFTLARNALLASSVIAAAAGCAGGLYARSSEGQAVEDDSEVVYVEAPPVVDIETYPVVAYGGANVYYVDGRWYQRGPRGWGYYRQEPPELGRQRQEHLQRDRDPRWAAHPAPAHRGQDERVAPPNAPLRGGGVTEAQPRDQAPAPRPMRKAPVKSAPVRPTDRQTEHR
ncbi:MAG TPA: hypothetical protein VKU41_02040 [Polyangiaceae bacterium]|nr:hypothetical protein [Polyangiaceae bacterium]